VSLPRRRARSIHLVVALTVFVAAAVGLTGALLVSRYRTAAIAALADRVSLAVTLRAHLVEAEVARLRGEMVRLSQLAEVDLADDNLEPEKRVLRIARRDTVLFSAAIFILDARGVILWSEPQGATLSADPRQLVSDALAAGGDVLVPAPGELDVAAPIPGRGAIVGRVEVRAQEGFGELLARLLRGGCAELVSEGRRGDVLVAALGGPFPLPGDFDGQSWQKDARRRRWLMTEVHIGKSPLSLRVAQPEDALAEEVAGQVRTLELILAGAFVVTVVGGALLARSIRRLEVAEVELDRSRELAAMGKTAAAIAHEVKNSLNGLSIALDLLASGRAAAGVAGEVHAQARSEIARLRGVADDLTLFAAPPRLDLGDADVAELCRRAVTACADLAVDCGARIRVEVPEDAVTMRGDAHKLLGAIQNVVRNGVEAMGPGAFGEPLGAARVPRDRTLDVALRRAAREVLVEVADRGPGIAAEVKGRLFEPFVTTKRTGTGLGLAIARRVVEAHGGRVEASPREGGGTVFRITLPVAAAADRAPAGARAAG
jgi:signal transduction histidine kinase